MLVLIERKTYSNNSRQEYDVRRLGAMSESHHNIDRELRGLKQKLFNDKNAEEHISI